ncbi:MAG: peptide deformylase [Nitrosomonadales bacterium]|jgi:peptide deformylase|nr:peptide deformylase [Nitrosomonadales bacterium]MCH9771541.1 peptide deformylase [Betaproteobacteria bacterium]|tara:strand:+ start:220 stop:735 length:516 start_codon:yes stop_codon:yes gene_type:complete
MAIREILRMGNPILLKVSEKVKKFDTPEIHELIKDMIETMKDAQGAGLAAPQVGESIQLVIFGVDKNERYPDAEEVPFTVLINPVITPLTQEKEDDWEGCLSVPGMRGVVPRYKTINYKGFDQYGNEINRNAEGFHARVVQHECDHLFGILYPSRIENMKLFGFHDEIFAE